MHITHWLSLGGAALLLSCSSSSPTSSNNNVGGGSPPPGSKIVTIKDFSFTPSTLTIAVGTTVVWVNSGPSAHTTVSDAGVWDSGTLSPPSGGTGIYGGSTAGGSFQYTFNTPGTYPYHCVLHPPAMYPAFIGTITVTP
jgi:plastocyanin